MSRYLREWSDFFFEEIASNNDKGVLPISSKCNARCIFCSNESNPFDIKRCEHRSVEEIEKVLWSMRGYKDRILLNEAITGKLSEGEVFLHPQFWEIMDLIKKDFPTNKIEISTNGSMLTEERIKKCSEYNINLSISIHSVNEENWCKIFRMKPVHFQRAINSFDLCKKYRVPIGPRIIALPSMVGYDDIEETIKFLKSKGYFDLALVEAAYTKYTEPDVVDLLKLDKTEFLEFINKMKAKYHIRIGTPSHPLKAVGLKSDLFIQNIQHAFRNNFEEIFWFTSTLAKDRVSEEVKKAAISFPVKNYIIEVKNNTFGGNISCAGLWTISDVRETIEACGLKNKLIVMPSNFLNKYGYDLMDENICDFLKTSTNNIMIIK